MLYLIIVVILLKSATGYSADVATDPVEFYRWNGATAILLTTDYTSIRRTSYTFFIVHGWTENATQVEYIQIAKNYCQLDDTANIILVDYRHLAQKSYIEARGIANEAGTSMGNRIVIMLKDNIIDLNKVHMFGHSLGSHVCGRAAQIIKTKMINQRVPRISASDPAGPLFRSPIGIGGFDPLQETETNMLDITHTSYTAGTFEAFGTVDTYVGLLNENQPACDGDGNDTMWFCNHRMARAYFTESILSCGFLQSKSLWNLPASSNIIYGQHMPLNATGVYYLCVNAEPPYAQTSYFQDILECIKQLFNLGNHNLKYCPLT